jgi:hypothetical protein
MSSPGSYGSLLDDGPRGPRPTKIEPDSSDATSDTILVIVSAIIIIGFFIWMSVGVAKGISEQQYVDSQVGFVCSPGQCAVDKITGEKICPEQGSITIGFNFDSQVCSDPGYCTDSIYRYAIQPDGSTNSFGICDDEDICRCSPVPTCPRYITSTFDTIFGNPYTGLSFTETSFTQSQVVLPPGQTSGVSFSSARFCSVPFEWIFRSSPGCNTVVPNQNAVTSVTSCIDSNPCLSGTLAYISSDSSSFDTRDLTTTTLSCVQGKRCIPSEDFSLYNAPIYDTNYGGVVCRLIPISQPNS